jgi:hypothetical protein
LTYLASSGENLLDLLAHNTFYECAKERKQIGQNLYKKINTDPDNSYDIRYGFKAALRCLEAAVFLLLNVLKAHSKRSVEKFANKLVVLSYHSTITHERDANYHRQNRSYRDLEKTQYNKTNQLEALIEMGDLEDKE